MLNDVELQGWFQRLHVSDEAQVVIRIRQIRCSDPARRVGGGRRNVIGVIRAGRWG
jgi:putative transposase